MSRVDCVELIRIGRSFGSTVALRGVTARFEPGRLHLVVGPNGSGKTTLLRIVSTMLKPSFGRVTFGGLDETSVRATVGWLSHDALVYPDLSGQENLLVAAGLYGHGTAAVDQVVGRFGIGGYLSRPVRTMSRGQRQRIALARALMHGPSLLLLDEPSTGLDSDGVEVLRSVVRDEVGRGALVLVVTHDPVLFEDDGCILWTMARGRLSSVRVLGSTR